MNLTFLNPKEIHTKKFGSLCELLFFKGMVMGKTTLQLIKNKTQQTSKLNTLLHRSFQAEQGHMHI